MSGGRGTHKKLGRGGGVGMFGETVQEGSGRQAKPAEVSQGHGALLQNWEKVQPGRLDVGWAFRIGG